MTSSFLFNDDVKPAEVLKGKKILFANFPADGHFNPLTGLAVFLKNLGCDVRWYTSTIYGEKLGKLNIPHYPFKQALEARGDNLETLFPERERIRGQVQKLKFDMINVFILRSSEYYADLREIQKTFAFDVFIADCAFAGIPFVKEKMNVPVISIGVLPLTETSKDLPPAGLGLTPSSNLVGRLKDGLLRAITRKLIFGGPNRVMWQILDKHQIPHKRESIFDMLITKATVMLQSGTPGFEYKRSDLSRHIHYAGALLPYSTSKKRVPWFDARLTQYEKIVLVTQGTVEKDPAKILVPTLEAFKNTDTLVVATTGGSKTLELRRKFPHRNIIIEDFIPFGDVMPYADVYITNGGYGGVLLGIENELPLVVAGVHEGKNEINARIGYFELGINLRTEWPKAAQIKAAVEKVVADKKYKQNVVRLSKEFTLYNPGEILSKHVVEALQRNGKLFLVPERDPEKVY
jgi:UDP:flavonoid glycosyltransferase YjiC (YdhE family)